MTASSPTVLTSSIHPEAAWCLSICTKAPPLLLKIINDNEYEFSCPLFFCCHDLTHLPRGVQRAWSWSAAGLVSFDLCPPLHGGQPATHQLQLHPHSVCLFLRRSFFPEDLLRSWWGFYSNVTGRRTDSCVSVPDGATQVLHLTRF